MKPSGYDKRPLNIRSEVWLSLLGVMLLGIIALSLAHKAVIREEQSFEMVTAMRHSSFAKFKRSGGPAASSHPGQRSADEIDVIDFSVVNDRSNWVDPAWVR
ncbi:MAG TPA: hypothetical protein VGF13_03940 [Verrucomicrobiae bacterium]|jgi:hypothetical protein